MQNRRPYDRLDEENIHAINIRFYELSQFIVFK